MKAPFQSIYQWRIQFLATILTVVLILLVPVKTVASDVVDVYFFHSTTCPHCLRQKPLMEDIDTYNPDVKVHLIEVSEEPQTWQDFRERYNIRSGAVPRTFVGEMSFVGYSESDGSLEYVPAYEGYIGYHNQILDAIATAVGHTLQLGTATNTLQLDTATNSWQFPWLVLGLPGIYLISFPLLRSRLQSPQARRYWWGGLGAICLLSLFLLISLTPDTIIKTFAQQLPFPLFVSTIALADGFNPCAFTVLIILLSLLTHTKRRRDMLLIGGTFIITSAAMYFLFIMVMIGMGALLLEHYGQWFLLVLGIGVAIAGLINIKDYFWFKQGVSLSLSADEQRTITQKASRIVRALNEPQTNRLKFLAALGSTVILAIFVNTVELGCTAILPVVYMTTLVNYCNIQSVDGTFLCQTTWTFLYAVLYIVPLGLILANFIYSFESTRLSESQGRRLKLVGGLFMLFFGLVMIFQPELLLLT
ncbi:thioredoxin family protein [Adonisia turfae]|uniref:Thioredoxin n=1 Tax=Adonisia turfae CCMR0081 TaxID=2292702 RepID=A0A6M0RXD6_9CYAN|nr:thioredoxin family protein [Adonisia turfae]NEZ60897.1 thioredoxin [Adonisia turfae CCMR0081]